MTTTKFFQTINILLSIVQEFPKTSALGNFAYIFLHLGMDAICCNKPADITEHLQATAPAKSLPLPTEVNKAIE
jgi:hypothetical protein